jgi:hypothetical protein
MFRVLLVHPQEALLCGTVAVLLQPCHSQLTLYTRNIQNAVCVAPPVDEQVMLETRTGL